MLQVLSGVAQVTVDLPGPGGVSLYALKRSGADAPMVVAEAYDAEGLVAAGELSMLDVNQTLTSLRARGSQARRLALRDDGRGHGGYLDLVTDAGEVTLVATRDDRRALYATTTDALAADVAAVLHHYLALTRSGTPRTIVLPDAGQASARTALIRPVP